MATPFLSVIIPALNEETRIIATLEKVAGFLGGQSYGWEIVVVDNGSSDRTAALVGEWAARHRGVRLEAVAARGKGWTVRHGMLSAAGEYRFMCDADLAMSIDGLGAFLDRMSDGYDVVIGSRQVAGARRFNEPKPRHVMGRIFNRYVRLVAVGGFDDTQCGFKCFRSDVAEELFGLQRTGGFAFDVEILYLALKRGFRVLEMPIDWHHQRDTKVRPGLDAPRMMRDTLMVRWHDARGRYSARPTQRIEARPSGIGHASVTEEAEPATAPASGDPMVAVVVPTYNESENLHELADRLFALAIPNTRMIVVDDSSPDGTAQVARALARKFSGRLEVIERPHKLGLGTAYVEGFTRALAEGADYVIQMDADLSHTPEYIPYFLEALNGADVVVGSRYVEGAGVDERWGVKRRLLSALANIGIRIVGGLGVKDATSGFKAYRGDALRSLELARFRCKGFGFQAEVARACQQQGYEVAEYPIRFASRTQGRSKVSLSIVLEALWRLLLLRWRR